MNKAQERVADRLTEKFWEANDIQSKIGLLKAKYDQEVAILFRKKEHLDYEVEMLKSLWKHGWIYYEIWSRDCDMCESTSIGKVQSLKAYYKRLEQAGESAEGPMSFHMITKEQYNEHRRNPPRSRDRVMEAYENGNGRSIYV